MTDVRPSNLPYRAKNGVIDTYVGSVEVENIKNSSLQSFIGRAIRWSKEAKDLSYDEIKSYRLLDSFMTDAISLENLELIFSNRNKYPVKILLAHPDSEFASVRAHARDPEAHARNPRSASWNLTKKGLFAIASALNRKTKPVLENKEAKEILQIIIGATKQNEFEVRFYNSSPGSPLYFLLDLVLVGRFGAGVTSADLHWELIVDDPTIVTDIYSTLSEEFEMLWKISSPTLETLLSSTAPLESDELAQVFISHSTKDKAVAQELKKRFEEKDIRAFVAELDIRAGDDWSEEIRRNLRAAKELVVLLSNNSKESAWVNAECGAAWALNKTITPATIGLDPNVTLQFVKKHQSIEIAADEGKKNLIEAVCNRIKKT